ncbi:bifunctional metallophosphatase/5'-nucleotidase [Actinomyces sp. oral taxon 171]|uniref:bifunctional metallophosphatase/5'-nucleotidase n=1 Tax=Actinomyces sp. oral taxon 171 TaxID=706438 RepID=UPI001CEE00BF|nr:5'-nucleotidase C-terminal domain-containing protein [Actinomyces sp. oral taxon 171]
MISVPTASLMPPAAAAEKPPDGADGLQGADDPGNKVSIKLVGLGGLHGHYLETSGFNPDTEEYDLPKDPGLVGIECAVRGIREDFPNTLVVSSGGNVGASPHASSFLQDRPVISGLNTMELDASALGVHALDGGVKDLEDRILPASDFPILAANVSGSDALSAEGSGRGVFIKEVDGVRVGFIGVVTDDLPARTPAANRAALTVSPAVATANARAAELKDGDPANGEADIVVVLSHEDMTSTATGFSKNVDAVVAGRSGQGHGQVVTGFEGNAIPVVQPGRYGRTFGDVLLEYDRTTRKTFAYYAHSTPIQGFECRGSSPDVLNTMWEYYSSVTDVKKQPLAHIGADFLRGSDGSVPDTNAATESTAADLVAESYRSWITDIKPPGTSHYVGIVNSGDVKKDLTYLASGNYNDIPRLDQDGLVSYGEALGVQPDNKALSYATLNGAELKALIAQQWRFHADPAVLNLGLSSNMDVIVDPGATAQSGAVPTVREIRVDGQVLGDTDTVVVASTHELLDDGVDFTIPDQKVIVDVGSLHHSVFISYLHSFGDKPLMPSYSKRQVGMSATPKPGQAGTVTVTMDSLAYTNASEQTLGAQRVRARSGDKEFFSQNIDLTVDRSGPTTGKASFDLTFPADAPTGACRTASADSCRWVTLESVNAAGRVLNSFYVEVPADAAPTATPSATASAQPVPPSAPSAAPSTPSAGPSAGATATAGPSGSAGAVPDGKATASPGGGSADGATVPVGGAGGLPAATSWASTTAPEVRGAGAKPAGGSGTWPLARTGTSLSAGVVALTLIVGGYLILRRRRQEG